MSVAKTIDRRMIELKLERDGEMARGRRSTLNSTITRRFIDSLREVERASLVINLHAIMVSAGHAFLHIRGACVLHACALPALMHKKSPRFRRKAGQKHDRILPLPATSSYASCIAYA